MKDYYKILGVEKGASKDDIKKAFRKQAHQYHPDKTKNDPSAAQKFKEASEAYSVLSDDGKRKQYDTFGSAGPGFNTGAAGFDPNNFGGFDFSGFQQGNGQGFEFDLGDIFGEFFGGGRQRQARQHRGHDISIDIQISFEESIFGVERDIILTKASKCQTCNGSGGAPGSGMETCKTCNGKGKINETRRSFIGVFSTTKVCDVCHGKGQVPKNKCSDCNGLGVNERQQEISVKIPAGIEDGEMVRLGGMGEAIPDGVPGDLYVKIHVKPHGAIRKEGSNLIMDLKIKLTAALTGATMPIKTLDGEVDLSIPEGTNTGDILRIKGKGVPNERGKRGDLLIKIAIDIPKKLSKSAKQAIEELRKEGL
jgi:molecular chaperone DnaJ